MGPRDAYAQGAISIAEFERIEERRLLRSVPRDHPVPAGWAPLEPCEHDWIEITTYGEDPHDLCAHCSEQRWR